MLCIADEAARLWVASRSKQERGWVPRRELESLLGLMHEVEKLRVPLLFGRAHADLTLSEGGAVATIRHIGMTDRGPWTAASKVVMRSGRHSAQFTVVDGIQMILGTPVVRGDFMLFGVIRPGWDVEEG